MAVPKNIIIEMIPAGNFVKVSAICEDTGTEVSIVGDASASKSILRANAIRKLKYVMAKNESQAQPAPRRGFEA